MDAALREREREVVKYRRGRWSGFGFALPLLAAAQHSKRVPRSVVKD